MELKTKLLDEIELSIAIELRNIFNEGLIKNLLKRDYIVQNEDKYYLVRYIVLNESLYTKDKIGNSIASLFKKQSKLKAIIFEILDFSLGIKLN